MVEDVAEDCCDALVLVAMFWKAFCAGIEGNPDCRIVWVELHDLANGEGREIEACAAMEICEQVMVGVDDAIGWSIVRALVAVRPISVMFISIRRLQGIWCILTGAELPLQICQNGVLR